MTKSGKGKKAGGMTIKEAAESCKTWGGHGRVSQYLQIGKSLQDAECLDKMSADYRHPTVFLVKCAV